LKKYLLLGVGLCLFLLSSCKKDKDSFVPYELDGEISTLIDALLSESRSFTVPPNTNQSITIDKSTELRLNAESLFTVNQSNIDIKWSSTFSAVEMELLKLPNYTNGEYIKPIFTFEVNPTQGEENISINNQSPIELRIEAAMQEDAKLYFLSSEGWSPVGSQTLQYNEWTDVNGNVNEGYFAQITQNGWYSISTKEELGSETFSNFCIELPGEYTQGNTKSFVVLENDIIIPMSRVMAQGTFCTTIDIPIDQPMRLIVMSNLRKDNYQLYYSEQMMENGLIVAPIMEEKSIDEIKSILKDI